VSRLRTVDSTFKGSVKSSSRRNNAGNMKGKNLHERGKEDHNEVSEKSKKKGRWNALRGRNRGTKKDDWALGREQCVGREVY